MKNTALNIWGSALVILSALFFVFSLSLAEEDQAKYVSQPVTVSKVSGEVKILLKDAMVWKKVIVGTELKEGDKIKTGAGARAELVFKDGSFIRLKENTSLGVKLARQETSTKAVQYNLDFRVGEIMVELKKLKKGSNFKVETPTAVAAVRGTTYYMRTGTKIVDGQEKSFVEIYVDSDDIILFTNTLSGESCQVYQWQSSIVYDDGTVEEPHLIPPEERDAFKSGFDLVYDDAKKGMRDVDEEEADDDVSDDVDDTTEGQDNAQEDADKDRTGEQEIQLADVVIITPPAQEEQEQEQEEPEESPDFDGDGYIDIEDAFPEDDTIDPDLTFDDIYGNLVTVRGYGSRDELRQATIDNLLEIQDLRSDISDMLEDIQVRQFEAVKEEIFDHQAGKVMTDRWRNRVRVEEYVFKHPTEGRVHTVQILALNLRTGGPNAGISSYDFQVEFNRDIKNWVLADLPWDDYMDTLLVEEVEDEYDIELELGQAHYEEQVILYESPPNFPIPLEFSLEVKNPYGESVKVTESYGQSRGISQPSLWYQVQVDDKISINGVERNEIDEYNGEQYVEGDEVGFIYGDEWGEGWNRANRFTFLEQFTDESWLMGVFYLVDDNGDLVPNPDLEDDRDYLYDIQGIRDCINPDFNLEMVFLSSEFGGTPPNLPETISEWTGPINDDYERSLYNETTYNDVRMRTIDVITIPEITEPYRD